MMSHALPLTAVANGSATLSAPLLLGGTSLGVGVAMMTGAAVAQIRRRYGCRADGRLSGRDGPVHRRDRHRPVGDPGDRLPAHAWRRPPGRSRHVTDPGPPPPPRGGGTRSRLVRSGEDFDIIIGFLAFWALVLLVVTVWMEVTAQPALGWALGLLASLLALYGMVRLRRKLPPRR